MVDVHKVVCLTYVVNVLQEDGLKCLLDLLAGMDWDTGQSSIHTAALGCVKALMNNSVGAAVNNDMIKDRYSCMTSFRSLTSDFSC